jgi:hypothetical protein
MSLFLIVETTLYIRCFKTSHEMARKKYSSPKNKSIVVPAKVIKLNDDLKIRGNQVHKRTVGENVGGAISKYTKLQLPKIYKLALLGLKNEELADYCDVDYDTFMTWLDKKHAEYRPELVGVLFDARDGADSIMADRLYQRGLGYEHKETKFFMNSKGQILSVETTKHYPPDTAAATYWLNNKRGKLWKNKTTVEDPEGNPIQYNPVVNVITEPDKIAQLLKDKNEKESNKK